MKRIRIVHDDNPENPRQWDNVATLACWHNRYTLGDEQPDTDPADFRANLAAEFDNTVADLRDIDATDIGDVREHMRHVIHNVRCGYNTRAFGAAAWRDYREAQAIFREFGTLDDYIDHVLATYYIMLPLYLYDHSGITISTGPFSCPWDSGQVGFAYVTRERAKAEWGERTDDEYRDLIKAEVAEYDQYLTGDVYGFEIERGVPVTVTRPDGTTRTDVEWEHEDSCWGFFGDDPDENGMADHVDPALHEALRAAVWPNVGEWQYVGVTDET